MRLHSKIIATAIAVAMAVGTMSAPASAQQQQQQGPGILPTLVGPIGAAALFPSTSTFSWFTTSNVFSHKNYFIKIFHNWHQVPQWKYDLTKIVNHKLPGTKFDVPLKKEKVYKQVKTNHSRTSKTVGKAVVGCIFGSALATIAASVRKASAMGNPPRWRSQAEHERILASGVEKKYELTLAEANTAMAFCGLGSFALNWPQQP
jgi:hypothetical protein